MPENIESADQIEDRETAEFNLSMEIYNATRQMIAPAARMLVRRFAGPQPAADASPEAKRAWELRYKRVINEVRASIGD
jgi:hypothetical protein